jgi:hypothetical protein
MSTCKLCETLGTATTARPLPPSPLLQLRVRKKTHDNEDWTIRTSDGTLAQAKTLTSNDLKPSSAVAISKPGLGAKPVPLPSYLVPTLNGLGL